MHRNSWTEEWGGGERGGRGGEGEGGETGEGVREKFGKGRDQSRGELLAVLSVC